jgi:O-antigen/teichoic acid export membrane protein
MSARVLANNAAWSLLCHATTRGSLTVAAIVLARHADTASFAAYSYFQLTISMLAAYAAMGLGVAASRFFADPETTEGNDEIPVIGTLWGLSCILAVAISIIIALSPSEWVNAGLRVPQWLLALGALTMALGVVPGGAILGLERYRHAAVIAALSGSTVLLGSVCAVNFGQIRIAMYAMIGASLVQTCGETLVVMRALGWSRAWRGIRFRACEIRRVLNLSAPMFLVSLMSASGGWIVGRIILNGPGGQSQFALFTIGLQWFALAMVVPGMLSRVLMPRLVRAGSGITGGDASRRLVRATIVIASSIALAVGVVGVLMGHSILRLYGHRYAAAGTSVIATFLGAAVLCAPANTIGNALVARDGQWHWLLLTALWASVLVACAYAFRAQGDWAGGATYAVAYGTLTGTAFLLARRRFLV